jgi:hypothetical protein
MFQIRQHCGYYVQAQFLYLRQCVRGPGIRRASREWQWVRRPTACYGRGSRSVAMTTRTSDWDQDWTLEKKVPLSPARKKSMRKPAERRLTKSLRCWAFRALTQCKQKWHLYSRSMWEPRYQGPWDSKSKVSRSYNQLVSEGFSFRRRCGGF